LFAASLNDLRVPPANRLEKLRGERLGLQMDYELDVAEDMLKGRLKKEVIPMSATA